jgi:hypothetical protein
MTIEASDAVGKVRDPNEDWVPLSDLPYTEPVPGLRVIDNVYDRNEEAVQWINENLEFSPATTGAGEHNEDIRSSDMVFLPLLGFRNPPVIHKMNEAVWKELDRYAHDYEFGFGMIEDPCINRYMIGQSYVAHQDYGDPGPMRGTRVVSALLYLNDVDFGGETVFSFFNEAVKPQKGRLVIFPSNYLFRHAAEAPMTGTKYSAAYWARG